MKVRSGFVSNSSSSSFVLVGWIFDRDSSKSAWDILEEVVGIEVLDEMANEADSKTWNELDDSWKYDIYYEEFEGRDDGIVILNHEEQGAPKGKTVVGRMLHKGGSNDHYIPETLISLQDVYKLVDDLPYDKNDAVIFMSTMCC